MPSKHFKTRIKPHIDREIRLSEEAIEKGDLETAFRHLERAHVLGQSVTREHTRVHWLMLRLGRLMHDRREVLGQTLRIIGASTKTPFGIYPTGNTGGSNVSPIKPMPVPDDLQQILNEANGSEPGAIATRYNAKN